MRIALICFCLLLLAGCTDKERIPGDIFPKEKGTNGKYYFDFIF